MKLKPVRFIGHNIGPFEHVELNWEKDSRYTLIVAENGMGKTTLVAAMAAVAELLPETYIIATTHSPFVLGATDDAQVFQIRQDEQGRLFAQAGFDELYGYPADLILEKAFVPSLYAPARQCRGITPNAPFVKHTLGLGKLSTFGPRPGIRWPLLSGATYF
jgi:hypothetical protein